MGEEDALLAAGRRRWVKVIVSTCVEDDSCKGQLMKMAAVLMEGLSLASLSRCSRAVLVPMSGTRFQRNPLFAGF